MRHAKKGRKLATDASHYKALLNNLSHQLLTHEKINTTEAKAKELRPHVEKIITFAKRGDIGARREVLKLISDKDLVHRLFAEVGPKYSDRNGGYTRIIKTGFRKGDNAPMAIIELV